MFTLRDFASSLRHARSDRHKLHLLWVKVNEVNYLAVSSQRVQISERRLNICKLSKERVGACKDYVIGREITSATALKTAVDNAIL